MADLWLPGWTHRPLGAGVRGKPYQYTHNPKACVHTTEGGSIAGAVTAYAPYPPHLIYDWRSREKVQHVPLNLAAYSAMDGNDDDYMIQIELVGYARETRNWPEQALRAVAEDVARPLEQHFGVPRVVIPGGFKDERDGIRPYLSSAESPIRLTLARLRDFAGWLGHQHLPAPDTHWDPGAIPMGRILSYLSEEDDVLTGAQEQWLLDLHKVVVSGARRDAKLNLDLGFVRESTIAEIGKVAGAVAAVAERVGRLEASGVPVTVDYERLAAALADEMDRRGRDDDPTTGPTT